MNYNLDNNNTKSDSQYSIQPIDSRSAKSNTKKNTYFENYSPLEYTESYRILCTPSTFAKNTLFYIQEIGKLKSLKSHTSKRESLDSYLYIIVKSGSGLFTYEGRTYTVNSGNHIFIDCKRPYSHQSSHTDPWELVWVHFNGVLMKQYFDYYTNKNTSPLCKMENTLELNNILEELMTVASNKGTKSEIISSNLLNNLITLILVPATSPVNNSPSNTIDKIRQIKDYLDSNFQKKIHLDMIVEDFYISKYHMSREFKKAYGITIANYVIAKRITYAKELLRFSDIKIEKIGRICGIEDNSYFNKVFRKCEGMTATDYRIKWRGKH